MRNEPVIIIHGMDEAIAALNAAVRADVAVLLLSQRNGALISGGPMFREMIAKAAETVPSAAFEAALDCGDHPGCALAAIRAGVSVIVFDPSSPAFNRIADVARKTGATVRRSDVYSQRRLDLSQVGDPARACDIFLSGREPCRQQR